MPGMENPDDASKPKAGTTSTNAVTIDVKLRALNLDKQGNSGLNGQLAYAVEEAFKKDPIFDSDGTKLAGEIQAVDSATDTFTFGLTLKLKNQMRTM